MQNKICLIPSCILNVPLAIYEDNFSFFVNGKEFRTNRIIADLLSPVICKYHMDDPTMNTFTINTKTTGDFSQILKLVNFETQTIESNEMPFITEIIEVLNNKSIEINNDLEITNDNVFDLLKSHEQNQNFYSRNISKEIEFISKHFYELYENHKENLKEISIDSLIKIFTNNELTLSSEDQLLETVNFLYIENSEFSILYETVYFENASSEKIHEFIEIFDQDLMNCGIWKRISKRLEQEIKFNEKSEVNKTRYKLVFKTASNEPINLTNNKNKSSEFDGIFNHFQNQQNFSFSSEVTITSSSSYTGTSGPLNVILYNEPLKCFVSKNGSNNWIKFEFKNHRVKPTSYTIKSRENARCSHPKSWVIEGSNDDESWEILDEENDCEILRGANIIHTFQMNKQNSNEFRFIRMRITGQSWGNNGCFTISKFELHGTLI